MALPATYDLAVAAELAAVQTSLGILPRSLNLVALLGDSRKEQAFADSASTGKNKSNWNHMNWAAALSGQRIRCVYNGGKSGDRTDQFFARLPNVLSAGAGVCFWQGGVNNVSSAYTHAVTGASIALGGIVASVLSDIQQQVDAMLAANIRVVLFLDPGASNLTAAAIGRLNAINEGIRSYAEGKANVYLFDLPSIQRDGTTTTNSALAFKTNYMRNESGIFTHENTLGAYYAGVALANLISTFIPPLPLNYVDGADIPSANSLTQLMLNPLFTTTTGGSLTPGSGSITGNAPANWNVRVAAGTAAMTLTYGANPNGPGNELIIAYTFNAAGDAIRVQQDATLANWSQGDIVQMCSEVSVDAGSTGLAGPYNQLLANGDGSSLTAMDMLSDTGHGSWPSVALTLQLQTPKFVVPAWATKGYLTGYPMWAIASGAGTGTIRVRSAALRKRAS